MNEADFKGVDVLFPRGTRDIEEGYFGKTKSLKDDAKIWVNVTFGQW